MRRMLVTGGAGFIGANFVHHTLRHHPGYRIRVLDALTYAGDRGSLRPVESEIEFVRGDVCDAGLVDRLVGEADVVVHFAAESHVDNSLADAEPFVRSNVVGTYTVLEAVRRHRVRMHHVSTDEVFGELPAGGGRFSEGNRYDPSSPYAATKAASDLLVRAWRRSYRVAVTVSNCGNNYGPFQHVEKFIPRQITNVLCGVAPRLYGSGDHVREWTHVEDHNAAVHRILAAGRPGASYLVGSGGEWRNRRVVELVLELMGRPRDAYEMVTDRPGHDLRYAIDSTRLRTELGWRPAYPDLRAGLAATIAWYRDNEWWWRPHKQATEDRYAKLGR